VPTRGCIPSSRLIIKSENFSIGFAKDISEFIILGRDIREVRRRFCKIYKA